MNLLWTGVADYTVIEEERAQYLSEKFYQVQIAKKLVNNSVLYAKGTGMPVSKSKSGA